jgi:hypothetical protein
MHTTMIQEVLLELLNLIDALANSPEGIKLLQEPFSSPMTLKQVSPI